MASTKITSVITGDIIASQAIPNSIWLPRLKKVLSSAGKSPNTWQIYRGDSFQIEVKNPADALRVAIQIKAAIKTVKTLDVRMAIGIGNKAYNGSSVIESDGEAFVRSGQTFENLGKLKQTLAISSGWPEFDRDMNVF